MREKVEIVVISVVCIIVGGIFARKLYLEVTYPTADEVVESIPPEMMPEGGRVWHSFGAVMIDNGGTDYVEIIDKDGQLWEFHRPHRGNTWTRTKWPEDRQLRREDKNGR